MGCLSNHDDDDVSDVTENEVAFFKLYLTRLFTTHDFQMLANVRGVQLLGMACKFKVRNRKISHHVVISSIQRKKCTNKCDACVKIIFAFSVSATIFFNVACEQALQDTLVAGWEKEGELQLRLRNLNICIEKVDAKC